MSRPIDIADLPDDVTTSRGMIALRGDDGQRPSRADLPGPGQGHRSRAANQLWVADLTYVAIPGGFV